ncbi:MAG: SRPBCC domain-containing protein [Gammaproteobacteria bacterium]|jgi:uncharacterized protein YndB with AHSA1/START domain
MIDPDSYDWSRFEIVFYYDRPPAEVFQAWSTVRGLTSFFVETANFVSPGGVERDCNESAHVGDRYRWDWRHPYWLEGEITRADENRELAFTFGSMAVSIRLADIDGQTELCLLQTGIPDSADGRVFGHLNCRSCWVFFLTNLKSVLGGGPDLRDQDPARVSSMEVGFAPLASAAEDIGYS